MVYKIYQKLRSEENVRVKIGIEDKIRKSAKIGEGVD